MRYAFCESEEFFFVGVGFIVKLKIRCENKWAQERLLFNFNQFCQQYQKSMSQAKTCFNRIHLNQGISTKNYIGCLVHYFMLSFVFVSIDSLQPMLLQQKFNIDKSESIENFKNSFVIAFDIIVKIICAPIFGYLADRKGRKLVNLYGIVIIAVTMGIMPYAAEFYQYVILRCIYATGAIAISVIPLLADYVNHKSRGTCAAFLVFMSSIGALSSAFLNFTILSKLDFHSKIYIQYGTAAVIILVIGLIYTIYNLKEGNEYYTSNRENKKSFGELVRIGKESLKNPQLASGYVAAFLARSDSILLSLYLVLWCFSYHEYDYETSSTKASALSGVTYTIIMLSCIIYGFIYQRKKVNRRNVICIMLVFALVGSGMMNFSHEISGFATYASLSILGVGMSGLLTASLYLVNEFSTPENRGYITGLQTLVGIIGIAVETFIGAVLYEFVSRNGPFNLFAFSCLIGIIITVFIYWRSTIKKSVQKGLNQDLISEQTIVPQVTSNQV